MAQVKPVAYGYSPTTQSDLEQEWVLSETGLQMESNQSCQLRKPKRSTISLGVSGSVNVA